MADVFPDRETISRTKGLNAVEHIDSTILYDQGGHKFLFLGWEEQEEETAVQTNQYVITSGDEVMLLDPGGAHVFPRVLANVAEIVDLRKIRHIFYSHQDPDVSSGITLWLSMAERATVHISGLWVRFLPHFGIYDTKRIAAIPDKGETLPFGKGAAMKLIPSHFLHSTGCFSLFDPVSRVLFSGDIGAAIFPKGGRYPEVGNFENHVRLMEGFHRRYMASNAACRKWVSLVRALGADVIAPQHGAIMKGENVSKFLDWFERLECGVDVLGDIYGR